MGQSVIFQAFLSYQYGNIRIPAGYTEMHRMLAPSDVFLVVKLMKAMVSLPTLFMCHSNMANWEHFGTKQRFIAAVKARNTSYKYLENPIKIECIYYPIEITS